MDENKFFKVIPHGYYDTYFFCEKIEPIGSKGQRYTFFHVLFKVYANKVLTAKQAGLTGVFYVPGEIASMIPATSEKDKEILSAYIPIQI